MKKMSSKRRVHTKEFKAEAGALCRERLVPYQRQGAFFPID